MSVSEAHAIDELHDRGPRSQQGLGDALRLQKSTVSRLVDQLVDRGWVERVADDDDGRVSLVELTALGHRRADRLASARRRLFAELLESIPATEHAAVTSALARLAEAAEAAEVADARV
jgi:DNA-binding MarR family transcriptional regulator